MGVRGRRRGRRLPLAHFLEVRPVGGGGGVLHGLVRAGVGISVVAEVGDWHH